eukprot:384994_1
MSNKRQLSTDISSPPNKKRKINTDKQEMDIDSNENNNNSNGSLFENLIDVKDDFWNHPSLLQYNVHHTDVKERKMDELNKTKISKSIEANEYETKDNSESKLFLLVIDTEINDWRDYDQFGKPFSVVDPDSRITQIAWSMYHQNGNKIQTKSHFIKPNGWNLSERASDYTKIKLDTLQNEGIPIASALEELQKDLQNLMNNNGYIGAHKYIYDATMIRNEIHRIVDANNSPFQKLIQVLQSDSKTSNIIDTCDITLLERLNKNPKFAKQLLLSNSKNMKKQFSCFYKKRNNAGVWEQIRKTFGSKLKDMHKFICGGIKTLMHIMHPLMLKCVAN